MTASEQRDTGTAALLAELGHLETSHARRRDIGETLAAIGDPRPGVGLRPDEALLHGVPDIDWLGVAGVHRIDSLELSRYTGAYTETMQTEEEVYTSPFCVARYAVTNTQFAAFVAAADGWSASRWWDGLPAERGVPAESTVSLWNHPKDAVTWVQAMAFCRWLTASLPAADIQWTDIIYEPHGVGRVRQPDSTRGWVIRLPLEHEWKLAAGDERPGARYPWGEFEPDARRMNASESGLGRPVAVGMYPHGASPAGALDMCGNVSEWGLMRRDMIHPSRYALYGGSCRTSARWATLFAGSGEQPDVARAGIGFRLVYGPALERVPSPWPAGIRRSVLRSRPA